jgi:hypothetical protein
MQQDASYKLNFWTNSKVCYFLRYIGCPFSSK